MASSEDPSDALAAVNIDEQENYEGSNDDAFQARKMLIVEQLTSSYGFDVAAVERTLDEVGPTVTAASAMNYILDHELGKDRGGSVVPKCDCPHVKDHVLIGPSDVPDNPHEELCTHFSVARKSQQQANDDEESSRGHSKECAEKGQEDCATNKQNCSTDENWLCLECGVVRCSRYVNAHGLAHWTFSKSEGDGSPDGHCVAASLADLSVWCHICQAYIHDSLLDPLMQKLEQNKFREVEGPKKKKFRSSENLVSLEAADNENEDSVMPMKPPPSPSSSESNEEHSSEDNDGDETGDIEHDEHNETNDDDVAPSILQVAAAAARGFPVDFLQSNEDSEEEIEYPFGTLPQSLEDVANFITSDKCRSILILAGAGMSVAAGIPDFRSAGGLYATLKPELLTANPVEREAIRMDPTMALDQGLFLQNPLPCLELNRKFILGTHAQTWKATLSHRFVELLHAKTGKLVRLYTQNIDGLEDQCTQLPREKVIAVHGSMDRAECATCGEESNFDQFCQKVQRQIKDLSKKDKSAPSESTPIDCMTCGSNTMKPAIVLFRASLPQEFFDYVPRDILEVDLLIVIGTSLRVAPASSLVCRTPKTAMRLLVNREPVGWHLGVSFGGASKRDYFAQGDCDSVLLELMTHLGWLDDLEPLLSEDKLPESSADLLRERLGDLRQSDSMSNDSAS